MSSIAANSLKKCPNVSDLTLIDSTLMCQICHLSTAHWCVKYVAFINILLHQPLIDSTLVCHICSILIVQLYEFCLILLCFMIMVAVHSFWAQSHQCWIACVKLGLCFGFPHILVLLLHIVIY